MNNPNEVVRGGLARDASRGQRAAAVDTPAQVADDQRDGAVCLRGLLSAAEDGPQAVPAAGGAGLKRK